MNMKDLFFVTFFAVLVLVSASCSNGFEKIRTSNDTQLQFDRAFEYFENEDYLKARTLFELLLNSLRGKEQSEKVYFYYARTYYEMRNYRLAASYFQNFYQTFANSQYTEDAEFLSAYSNYKLSNTFRLDQGTSIQAIDELQLFINKYPSNDRIEECNNLIDELQRKLERKAFEEGKLYRDLRQWESAKQSLNNMIKDFPDSDYIEEARFMVAECEYLIAVNSIRFRQQERFENAIEAAEFFLKKYPESKYKLDIEKIIRDSNDQLKDLIK
ncbi:MAG: outer membrane protein assembly factor BamD [Bacteroidia bacterium]|nr:outer membrane protein assembly factor BamD [Bacteroidia bacterium]